ncbi:aromatic ring-hydroxylating oxygenase subunit alpha [Thalassotalea euphylliae]|uniref:Aromatic ring-hydroxylating dioxygenase subunit alpha n=1 Tax=Thalassotalea euphylliae TaxID=1655234 RepID=A0A3E0UKS5_9GAMM|nr:aromatic ring-hydroxylating dioxygenase subunit alpha [Thalassotalea euphylliae]REL36865.1 aromatic ring-hydroxylating dioxygenase subunit alpha [Thalassotalea euphylliae]
MLNAILPVEAYTSEYFFQLEQRHIFTEHWQYAGLVEDLIAPGDYLTAKAGLADILVVKGQDNQLSAYHNACRHRGTRLLDGKGKIGTRIVCPYHNWSYDLAGNLLGLPEHKRQFSQLEKSCYGLKPAKVGVWRGMIWVHAQPDAIELADWFAPMAEQLAPYDVELLIESPDDFVSQEINANWKIVVENYIDHYHLAHLHSGTLSMYDHKRAQFGFAGQHFHFWEPLSADYQQDISTNAPLPLLMDKTDPKLGAWVPMLFPGIGLAETESSWSVFHIVPLAADKTRVNIRTKVKNISSLAFMSQAAKSYAYWQRKVKANSTQLGDKHPLGSGDFMQEDVYVCEQLQQAMKSPYFSFGPLAERSELPVYQHQQLVWQLIAPHWQT